METGLYVQVFTSVEVIVAALFLIFLLPLVFFIASTKSRRKLVRLPAKSRKPRPVRSPPQKAEPSEEDDKDLDAPPSTGPRRRSRGPAADPDDPE
jgi:hypothetical protein